MFILCQKMEWNHLPVTGGVYEQDPELLRRWGIIFHELDKKEEAERKKQDAQRKRVSGASRSRR